MAFLLRVLTAYGWYVAAVVFLGFLLAAVLWLRLRVPRWWRNKVAVRLGTPRRGLPEPQRVTRRSRSAR
jgi:hypothetical protein